MAPPHTCIGKLLTAIVGRRHALPKNTQMHVFRIQFVLMDADTLIGGQNGRFPDTRPSAISAAVSKDEDRRRPGQEAIVAAYWKPVYRYIRVRWRRSNEDAKDLTQSFFAAALEKGFFEAYDAGKGTFRTFLRVCLDRFLANDRKFETRQKRSADFVAL